VEGPDETGVVGRDELREVDVELQPAILNTSTLINRHKPIIALILNFINYSI
jgi:hypothetical protein